MPPPGFATAPNPKARGRVYAKACEIVSLAQARAPKVYHESARVKDCVCACVYSFVSGIDYEKTVCILIPKSQELIHKIFSSSSDPDIHPVCVRRSNLLIDLRSQYPVDSRYGDLISHPRKEYKHRHFQRDLLKCAKFY